MRFACRLRASSPHVPPSLLASQLPCPHGNRCPAHRAADVSGASTSIRFHVAHTSCWVKKYRVPGNDYYNNELTYCVSPSCCFLAYN